MKHKTRNDPGCTTKAADAAENRTQGVVPCLHRLYIHLGDLFRYSNQYAKAQTSYQRAAQLAPFTGHAYNQIAVTVQVQEQDSGDGGGVAKHAAVTLFWYARSLASVRDPFTTARSNLNRLFQGNREWLKKHQQQQQKQQQQVVLAGSASRLFLATFVDLQYDLSCSGAAAAAAADSTDADTTKAVITDQFYNHLTEAVASFRQLLASSALGDSLLCKLVTIAAFSEWQHQQPQKQPNAVNANSSTKTAVAAAAARTATFELGTCLAERVATILQSKQRQNKSASSSQSQSQQSTAAATSVRVLMPLLLLTEYLMLSGSGSGTTTAPSSLPVNDDSRQRLASAHRAFWMAAVEVYNMLSLQQQQATTSTGAVVIEARGDGPSPLLKEHQMLRGFAPFEPFLKQARPEDDELTADGYLADEAASRYLDAQENNNSNSQTSQQTLGSTLSSSNQEDAGRLKIQRFLGLPWTTAVEQIRACEKPAADGPFLEWVDTAATAAPMEEEEEVDAGNEEDVMMDDDDEDNNLLVYQQPTETGGPALLVPGALLQQQPQTEVEAVTASTTTNPAPPLPATATATAAVPAPNTVDAASLLAGIVEGATAAPTLPPQQESLAFSQQQLQQQQQPLYPMQQFQQPVYPTQQQQAPPAAVLPPPGFGSGGVSMNAPRAPAPAQQMNPPFFGQLAPNFGLSSWAAPANTPTIGESYQLFGGNAALETSNPFAMDSLPTFGTGSFAAHNDSAFLASSAEDNTNNNSLEGTTMLDSGLLHSLLFDDSSPRKTTTTKNPFAT